MSVQTNDAPQGAAPAWLWTVGVVAFAVAWWLVYGQLIPFSVLVWCRCCRWTATATPAKRWHSSFTMCPR